MYWYTLSMKKGLAALIPSVSFFMFAMPLYAATLYMDPNTAQLKRGDTITVAVRLDAGDGECVNAVDGVITYSDNIQPVDISRGNSILSLWVEEPVIDKAKHTITFAGGIPNGYCGRIAGDPRLTNNVIDLQFQSPGLQIGTPQSGTTAHIDFDPQTHVFLNDGEGTIASTSLFGSQIELQKDTGNSIQDPWNDLVRSDQVAPEKFGIDLERLPDARTGRYYAIFNTTDKQTGIDHYEVMEQPLGSKNFFGWGAANAAWKTAKSPYVLEDQSLNSTIRVKAIDKAGNEYIATYVPDASQRTLSFDNEMIIIISAIMAAVLSVAIGIVVFALRRKRKHADTIAYEDDPNT